MIDDPSTRTSYLAWQFAQAVALRLERTLRPLDLSLAQHNALVQVALSPGISSAAVARRAGMTAQSMGTAVNGLLDRGLLERRPHPTNRRVMQLHPTESGLALVQVSQVAIEESNANLFETLSDEDEAVLAGLLRRLVQHTNPDALDLSRSHPD
ncbi:MULTISPECIES: MarR family winged helix-turn-helix transcriptional regulator [Streptacidiphilus]|uniref:MarR family winged helix-turn-helix transcriptional regulator n=1 Tax=Streptacidiphilus cavernicola TaxID=3342716 RepID=A0ABV6UHL4_9ACTN|nr:MarR family transcriptional regulator [Streptacidiphilus jeojiense]